MKRIGIVGHPENVERVLGVIESAFPDVTGIAIETREMSQIENTVQYLSEHIDDFDGVLFTGKILYDVMNHRMHSQNPWVYLDNDESQLQRILLSSLIGQKHDITKISIDSYTEDMVESIYRGIGLIEGQYHAIISKIDIFKESLFDDLIAFHSRCFQTGQSGVAITGISAICSRLHTLGIPAMLLTPNETTIKNTLHDLLEKIRFEDLTVSQIVVISVEIEAGGEYHWTSENEYGLMLEKTHITEEVYKFAQRIQAAVVESERSYLLFSTRKIVEYETKNLRELSLFRRIGEKTERTVSVGIGFGITAREAKANALIGKNKASKMGGNQGFVVYNRRHMEKITSVHKKTEPTSDIQFRDISEKSGVSANNIYHLKCLIDLYKKDTFTSHELADEFGNSLRSTNRMIEKLEVAGYVEVIGKKIIGKSGRPSRLLKFLL